MTIQDYQDWIRRVLIPLSFRAMSDTPGNYDGAGQKSIIVNDTETALLFSDAILDSHGTRHKQGGADALDPSELSGANGTAGQFLKTDGINCYWAQVAIPSGVKMLFKESSAPTGWTFIAEDNDRVILNTSTEADGGVIGGSWTISGFSFGVDGHQLTVSEMPSHQHKLKAGDYITYFNNANAWHDEGQTWSNNQNYGPVYKDCLVAEGGDSSHSHGFSSSHDGSWRPSYVKVITCQKD